MNSLPAGIIPIIEDPLHASLLKIPDNIAISGAGIMFLSAQITALEHRCTALHARSAIHACEQFKTIRVLNKAPKGEYGSNRYTK